MMMNFFLEESMWKALTEATSLAEVPLDDSVIFVVSLLRYEMEIRTSDSLARARWILCTSGTSVNNVHKSCGVSINL
jgi:hypothetical protein